MPLTLGPSDYTLFDGQQAGVFTHVLVGGNQTATITNAVGLGQTRREIQTDGGFLYAIEQEWWLPVTELGGIVPAEGDYWTDAGSVVWWLQSDIEYNAQGIAGTGAMYRVVTRQGRGASTDTPGGGVSGTFGS